VNQFTELPLHYHFSFHKDGTVHLTIKDASGYKGRVFDRKLANTISTMPRDKYGILFIYSIYDFSLVKQHLSSSKPVMFDNTKNVNLHFEFEDVNRVSLLTFLLGADIDAKLMLQTHFPSIINPGNSICIKDYLVNNNNPPNYLQLLVAHTTKVIPKPPLSALNGSKKFKQFERIENPIGISLACSDEHIREMV